METAGIGDELSPRPRPVAEHVGQAVARGAHENIGLEVLVSDRAVLHGVAGVGFELGDLFIESLETELSGEVVRDGHFAALSESRCAERQCGHYGGRGKQPAPVEQRHGIPPCGVRDAALRERFPSQAHRSVRCQPDRLHERKVAPILRALAAPGADSTMPRPMSERTASPHWRSDEASSGGST